MSDILRVVLDRFEAAKRGPNSCWGSTNTDMYGSMSSPTLRHGAKTQPGIHIDIIGVAIEGQCALLNDTPVDINIMPRHPKHELDALLYQHAVRWVLEDNDAEMLRDSVQKYALLEGVGVIKLMVADGRIVLRAADPRYVLVDPLAKTQDDIEYIIEVFPMSVEEIKARFGKRVEPSSGADVASPDPLLAYNDGEDGDRSKVMVYECWFREGDTGKYPFGRYVVATNSEVLEDRPSEYPCGFPYVFMSCYTMPDRLYGRSAYRPLKPIADELTMLYKRMSNITKLAANPTIALSVRSGLRPEDVTNADGGVLPLDVDDVTKAIQWIHGPGVSPTMVMYADKLQYYFDTVSGFHDVLQGRARITASVPSGRSIDELQFAAQTRVRQVMRNIRSAWAVLGRKILSLVNSVWTEEMMVRISGSDAETVNQVMMREYNEAVAAMKAAGARTVEDFKRGLDIYFMERGITVKVDGRQPYVGFVGTRLRDPADFVVRVAVGADVPKGKLDIAATAEKLLAMGVLDPDTFMEAIDFPLREKAIARREAMKREAERKMLLMQQAAAQGGSSAEGPPQMEPPQPMSEEPMEEAPMPETEEPGPAPVM